MHKVEDNGIPKVRRQKILSTAGYSQVVMFSHIRRRGSSGVHYCMTLFSVPVSPKCPYFLTGENIAILEYCTFRSRKRKTFYTLVQRQCYSLGLLLIKKVPERLCFALVLTQSRKYYLKVPKWEIFDRSDFPDFYTIKSLRVGDFGVKKKNLKIFRGAKFLTRMLSLFLRRFFF
jgi:hypothetical protein